MQIIDLTERLGPDTAEIVYDALKKKKNKKQ